MILVTGGTGLVGSHLLFELAKQNKPVKALIRDEGKVEMVKKVFSYYSDEPGLLSKKIDWVQGDMLDVYSLNKSFEDVTNVYHCAAVVSMGRKKKKEIIDANVIGTENIVNLCLQGKVEKLCHVSSIASLGNKLNGELIDEKSNWITSKNRSTYSLSKFKSEMEVWRGIQEGLNAVIVNPSVIIGPGFWNTGSGSLFTKAAKGMKYYTNGSTGFVDVRDVVGSMIKLMETEICNERFIINSENVNYKTLFEDIAKAVGVNQPQREATKKLLKAAILLDSVASAVGIKKKEITKEVVRASLLNSNYSNKKIIEAIGITFLSIKESIAETANKFKKELTIN